MHINGKPATVEDLAALTLYGYGSFTSLVVAAGRVRGLDLHLQRLQHDAATLFGAGFDEQQVRQWLREATVDATGPVSARITLFQSDFNMTRPVDGPPDVLITTRPAPSAQPTPMRVATAEFARDVPKVKHTGLFSQLYHRRAAQARGFDNVLFLDSEDRVSEGATWNIAFVTSDGEIRWPQADMLPGVTMRLLQTVLPERGYRVTTAPVPRAGMRVLSHAFATNAVAGIRPIVAIDAQNFALKRQVEEALRACWMSIPTDEI
ncbi:aminotransferase class IV [Streptomyces iakyrus]|uniref:aminotransferase class IV n=1 Tax=Streptomyces iakyrus TaxID=68219 RepID=UPI0033A291C4